MRRIVLLLGVAALTPACKTETAGGHPADGHEHGSASPGPTMSMAMAMPSHGESHGEAPGEGTPAEDHRHLSRHGGQVGMSANPSLHLEAVRTAEEVRVYVYDASMTPVSLSDVSGSVKVAGASLPLQPRSADGYLSAKFSKAGPATAAFELTVRGARVPMEFDLPEAVAASTEGVSVEIGGHVARIHLAGSKLMVEVTEKDGGPPDAAKNAKVVLQMGTEKKTVPLDGTEGHLSATVDGGKADKIVGVLQIDLDGKPASARFSLDRP